MASVSEQDQDEREKNILPNAEHLNRQLLAVAAGNGAELITEEDSMERKMILNIIFANDYYNLMNNKRLVTEKNLNWLEPHPKTDLDELISPLTCAAFLGRSDIVELLLKNASIDLEMATVENEYTALMAACMAGSLEVVSFLAENGADVNAMNSQGQTPLIHCFSRLTENTDCNPFENKSICFRIAEILFSYGADVNMLSMNRTLLMNFCGISMRMDPNTLEINLSVIQFLLQHGADPYMKCGSS